MKRIFFLLCIMLLVSGCPKNKKIIIFNNTIADLTITGTSEVDLKKQQSITIQTRSGFIAWEEDGDLLVPYVQIKDGEGNIYRYYLGYKLPDGMDGSEVRFQLNDDMYMYVLKKGEASPCVVSTQPNGFPLIPCKDN